VERCCIESTSSSRDLQKWVNGLVRRISGQDKWIAPINDRVFGDVDQQRQANMKRVLIIGDSLVVGIGCQKTAVLPQAICKQLAELLRVDVAWKALGVNGGDVRTIHKQVLEAVEDMRLIELQVVSSQLVDCLFPPQPHTKSFWLYLALACPRGCSSLVLIAFSRQVAASDVPNARRHPVDSDTDIAHSPPANRPTGECKVCAVPRARSHISVL
jgi:hypothetical protein